MTDLGVRPMLRPAMGGIPDYAYCTAIPWQPFGPDGITELTAEAVEAAGGGLAFHRVCRWCGVQLDGRRWRWCSDDHAQAWSRNHFWTNARTAALARDQWTCMRCLRGVGAERFIVAICGTPPDGWRDTLPPGLMGAWVAWRDCPLEVNHIDPRAGRGYGAGCHHHLDGLETLCRPCHKLVSAAQRKGWRGRGRELPRPDPLLV